MKKKLLVILICVFLVLSIMGCKKEENTTSDLQTNTSGNVTVESNQQNEKMFNIEQYPNIQQVSNKFIELLDKNTVNYSNILYKVSKYANGEYKNVLINLNENEYITMKFSDDGRLLALNLYGGLSETTSKDYENSKLSMLQFEYYNFTKNEISSALSSILRGEEYIITDYKISSTQYPSLNMFIITDIVNN